MLQMGRIMQCVFCQILASEIDVGYRDVAESEARRKLKQHCSAIAPRIAALSGATSPKESEARLPSKQVGRLCSYKASPQKNNTRHWTLPSLSLFCTMC